MASGLIVTPNYMPALDDNGVPYPGALMCFYLNDSTSETVVYQNRALTVAHENPVVANNGGIFPPVYADTSLLFSVRFTTAAGAELITYEGVAATGGTTFQQGGAGAVVRTMNDKAREIISLSDFVQPSDTTKSPAFARALAYAATLATGAVIKINRGINIIDQPINVGDQQNVLFDGEASHTCIVRTSVGMTQAFVFGSAGTAYQGIKGVNIDCGLSAACTAITVAGVDTFYLEDVTVDNADKAIQIESGFNQFFNNFSFRGNKTAGIVINGGNDQFFDNGVLYNSGTAPTLGGIVITKNYAVWMTNVDCINQNNGLYMSPVGTDFISWAFFMNCAFDQGTASGITLNPNAVGAFIKGVEFVGCWSSSNTNNGIIIGGTGFSDGIRFSGHRAFANGKAGVNLAGAASKNISFDACAIAGNSASSSGTYSGVEVAANFNDFSITNCSIGQTDQFDATQAYGIKVNTGTSTRYNISNNDLTGNITSGLSNGGSGTDRYIAFNLGARTQNRGAGQLTGASTVAVTHSLDFTPLVTDVVLTAASNLVGAGLTQLYVSAVSSTTFTVTGLNGGSAATPSSPVNFCWDVRLLGS